MAVGVTFVTAPLLDPTARTNDPEAPSGLEVSTIFTDPEPPERAQVVPEPVGFGKKVALPVVEVCDPVPVPKF